ncbi:hypothetical protein RP20_CCG010611 [Aedes albopictus]|nr:hypothetical protein RP20_CCG010611 [Aedes albopictus]
MGDPEQVEFPKSDKKGVVFGGVDIGCSVRRTWDTFVKDTSFLPLKRVLNKELSWLERLFWLVIIVIGTMVCSFGILLCGKKMSRHMLQVIPSDEPSPIWSVPFPAVTICGKKDEVGKMKPLEMFCEEACWDQKCGNCEALFTETQTEAGICFTFNNLAAVDLFNGFEIPRGRVLSNATMPVENWDVHAGYKDLESSLNYYPRRVMDLDTALKIKFRSIEYRSMQNKRTPITVNLHNPAEFAFRFENAISVEPGESLNVAVHPKVRAARPYLRFCPQSTYCCYNEQCQLQFFRIYSQQNCELECRTKYILKTRTCVQPYMPRPAGVTFCNGSNNVSTEQLQHEITSTARMNNIPPSQYFIKTCNCLPSCNDIRYKSVGTKTSLNETNRSEMTIHFDKDHFYASKVTIRYGIVDLFASIGGLLSLFLGVSLITIIETLYYFTLRPFLM